MKLIDRCDISYEDCVDSQGIFRGCEFLGYCLDFMVVYNVYGVEYYEECTYTTMNIDAPASVLNDIFIGIAKTLGFGREIKNDFWQEVVLDEAIR